MAAAGASSTGHRQLSLAYQAPSTCPGAQSYIHQVQSRATALSIDLQSSSPASSDATRVRIAVSETGQGWAGDLDIADAEGLTRTVRGDRCEDVIEALALITVLRLEPSAISARDASTAAQTAGTSTAGDSIATSGEAAVTLESDTRAQAAPETAAAQTDQVPAAGSRSGEPPRAVPSESDAPLQAEQRAALQAGGETAAPLASRTNIAAVPPPPAAEAVSGEMERPELPDPTEPEPIRDAPDAEPSPASPGAPLQLNVAGYVGYASVPSNAFELLLQGELPLGSEPGWAASLIVAYARGSEENANGAGVFSLWTAAVQLCGPALGNPSGWLQPCAAVRGGFLELDIAPGEQTFDPRGAFRPWAALGPGFQAGVPLASNWTLRALGELSFILVRDSFEVARTVSPEPGAADVPPLRVTFYRPSALSFELGIGLGYSF